MPIEVPSMEDLNMLIGRVQALEANQMPVEVRDALLVVLNWLTTQT